MVWQLPGCISTCLVVYAGLRQDGCGTSGSLSQLVPGMFVLTVSYDPMGRPSSPRLIQKHNTFGFSETEIEATLSFKYGKLLPRETKKEKSHFIFFFPPLPSGFLE